MIKRTDRARLDESAGVLRSLSKAAWLLTVCGGILSFPAYAQEGEEPGGDEGVKVSEYMTVDMFVQDEDLVNVLQMLAMQSQRNIVASRDVSATVSANLYGVTFYEALDAILHVNGYGYIERGNFIYVHTLEELEQIKAQERLLVSKVLKLNYLNANDAAEFVAPLLSEAGQIKTNGDVGEFTLPEDTPTGNEEFALSAMLVVFDYAENIEEIEALLDQIDTRPTQVLVEATIVQTELNEATAFGVDFSILVDVNFIDFFDFGGPLGAANALIGQGENQVAPIDNRGSAIVGSPGNTSGPATFKAAVIHDDVSIFLRLLDEVTDVSILSNPKILALNRQPARVLVGRKLGYLNTITTDTSTTQTVEFLDTGTQLAFRPFVSEDGMIRMELKPRVSEGVIREASDATGAAVTIPDEVTQEITTNVIVQDGSTIVLGGLFKETTNLKRTQVPIVGDIPIIGTAFRGYDDSLVRNEIIFMIKPTIMNDQVLLEQGERAIDHAERVRVGSRQGLLPFSRERQTASLNVKAERYAQEGKTDKALWAIRRSLELNPDQPDAIRIREMLMNDSEYWYSRSALEEIVNTEASSRWDGFSMVPKPEIPNGIEYAESVEGWTIPFDLSEAETMVDGVIAETITPEEFASPETSSFEPMSDETNFESFEPDSSEPDDETFETYAEVETEPQANAEFESVNDEPTPGLTQDDSIWGAALPSTLEQLAEEAEQTNEEEEWTWEEYRFAQDEPEFGGTAAAEPQTTGADGMVEYPASISTTGSATASTATSNSRSTVNRFGSRAPAGSLAASSTPTTASNNNKTDAMVVGRRVVPVLNQPQTSQRQADGNVIYGDAKDFEQSLDVAMQDPIDVNRMIESWAQQAEVDWSTMDPRFALRVALPMSGIPFGLWVGAPAESPVTAVPGSEQPTSTLTNVDLDDN